MATIYTNGYDSNQSAAASYQKSAPTGGYQAQQPQAQSYDSGRDPLFEALAKYITSGPGPSSASAAQIDDIINSYTGDAGRAYLQSIVSPASMEPPMKIWPTVYEVQGTIRIDFGGVDLDFRGSKGGNSAERIFFNGKSTGGFYVPQFIPFK